LQRLDLRLQSGYFRAQLYDLLLQCGVASGLGGAARASRDGLAYVHISSFGVCYCI
jgi:hypothetical protein